MSKNLRLVMSIAVVIFVLGAFVYLSTNKPEPEKHLPGATRLVFEPFLGKQDSRSDRYAMMQAGVSALRIRARSVPGATDSAVNVEHRNTIVVEIAGAINRDEAVKILLKREKPHTFGFYYLKDVATERRPEAPWQMTRFGTDSKGRRVGFGPGSIDRHVTYSFRNKTTGKVIVGDTSKGRRSVMREVINAWDPATNPAGDKPVLDAKDLAPTAKAQAWSGRNPSVSLQFSPRGSQAYLDFARRHVGEYLAAVLDERIVGSYLIVEPVRDLGTSISGGNRSLDEAEVLADTLNAGALPVELKLVKDE
jgi:preprotein translocase subunit SecD